MFVPPPDDPAELARPDPRRGYAERLLRSVRPWVAWFGAGRVAFVAVTAIAVVLGGWWMLRAPSPPTEAGLPYVASGPTSSTGPDVAPPADAGDTTVAPSTAVVVHVAGRVRIPGVYELVGGSRVEAAVAAAGGVRPGADLDALNLAAPLVDGQRIYVPRAGEPVPVVDGPAAPTPSTISGPIDLNTATAEQLDTLPGIGPATAAAIVDHRTEHGPFASVDDLEAVSGIGPVKLAAIRDLVTA